MIIRRRSRAGGLGGLLAAAGGLLLSVTLVWVLGNVPLPAMAPWLSEGISYLVVFLPLAGAVAFATLVGDFGSSQQKSRMAITWRELALGVALGIALHVGALWLQFAIYGVTLLNPRSPIPSSDVVAWIALAIVAPIIVAPVLEEVFFRGLLLRGLVDLGNRTRLSPWWASAVAITVSSLCFGLVHLIVVSSWQQMVLVGVMTFLLGCVSALLALRTGRLTASIALHVTYNALILIPGMIT